LIYQLLLFIFRITVFLSPINFWFWTT